MAEDNLEAWLSAMPLDDVRRRIERVEQELSDLRVLERLYERRQPPASEQQSSEWGSQ